MSEVLEELQRWIDSGGTWLLTSATAGRVELDLLTCTGDEVMGHLTSDDADVIAFVTGDA